MLKTSSASLIQVNLKYYFDCCVQKSQRTSRRNRYHKSNKGTIASFEFKWDMQIFLLQLFTSVINALASKRFPLSTNKIPPSTDKLNLPNELLWNPLLHCVPSLACCSSCYLGVCDVFSGTQPDFANCRYSFHFDVSLFFCFLQMSNGNHVSARSFRPDGTASLSVEILFRVLCIVCFEFSIIQKTCIYAKYIFLCKFGFKTFMYSSVWHAKRNSHGDEKYIIAIENGEYSCSRGFSVTIGYTWQVWIVNSFRL